MSLEDIAERASNDARSKWIGIYVGVLATLLAICGVGGGNAAKDATRANIEASNMWAFFQAKNMRSTSYALAADELELFAANMPGLLEPARQAFEAKVKDYRATVVRYRSDKRSNEGLDELFQRAKAIEAERDIAIRKDPYFDIAQALLQIAIVLASVALIAGSDMLLVFSGVLGALGTLLMVNGFFLLVQLPLLG